MPINTTETENATSFLQNGQNTYFDLVTGVQSIVPSVSNMATCSDYSSPSLTIQVQPTDKFRYRYKSEKGSHGVITGVSKPKSKKTYPMVKLENYPNYQNVLIKVSLWTDEEPSNPHVLDLVVKNKLYTCIDGACYMALKDDYTAQFPSMAIENKKKDEINEVIRQRKIAVLEESRAKIDMEQIKNEVHLESKNINLNSSRLCFEAYHKTDLNVPLCDRVFSSPIYNQKSILAGDLKIVRLGRVYGQCSGGDEILIFCDKVKKEDIKVRFYEKDESGDIVWEDFGTFNPAVDVHHQVGIAFRTPKYKENVEKVVCMDLFQPSDNKHGEGREFHYIPDETDLSRFSAKRKRTAPSTSCSETSASYLSSPEIHPMGEMGNSETFNNSEAVENSAFHQPLGIDYWDEVLPNFPMDLFDEDYFTDSWAADASEDAQSVQIDGLSQMGNPIGLNLASQLSFGFNLKEIKELEKGVRQMLKSRKDITKLYYVPQLISMQDECGNTLLHHVALEKNKDSSCIMKILRVIPEDVINKKNNKDQTALELAVRTNNSMVLNHLLINKGNPNIRNKEGNNCLHLASKTNAVECMKTLLLPQQNSNCKPDIEAFNFDGMTPLHLSVMNSSKNCLELLLKAKAEVNIAEAKCGRTPLHLAIEFQPSLIPILISQPNVDLHATDFRGYSPLALAYHLKNENYEEISSQIVKGSSSICSLLTSLSEDLQKLKIEESDGKNSQPLRTSMNCDYGDFNLTREEHQFRYPQNLNGNEQSMNSFPPIVERKLCEFLDTNSQWRSLGRIIGLDDSLLNGIAKFSNGSSPTETVLNKIKAEYSTVSTELLRHLLEAAELFDAVGLLNTP